MWSITSLDRLANDLRYGVRMMLKRRGFAAVAVLSLAVGIGASTVLFSFAYAFVYRPLNAANPAELVEVFTGDFDGPSYGGSSYPDYQDFRDRAGIFRGVLAETRAQATLSDRDRPEVVQGALVSPNYFEVLGLRPSRGRFLAADDNRAGAPPAVVLSHDSWQRRFAADPAIVGRVVGLNGQPVTVIGVGPPRFAGTSIEYAAEFFAPVALQPLVSPGPDMLRNRGARVFTLIGRLKEDVTIQEADAALRVVAAQLLLEEPLAWRDRSGNGRAVAVLPEVEARFAEAPGTSAWIFTSVLAGVFVLLGIACMNVATLLLGRAAARRKEIAVRLAIGASRGRLVQQLLTECALLAAAGGLFGLVLAQWIGMLFVRFRPDEAPPFDLSLDYRILVFAILASLLTTVLFGLAPALQSTRPDVNAELKDHARPIRVRRFRVGLRDVLVVVQVAVALTLIIAAALLARSLYATRFEDLGFRQDGVINVGINLSTTAIAPDEQARFYREAVRTVAGLPGVERVALAGLVPMDGSNRSGELRIGSGDAPESVSPDTNAVGPGYFAMMGIPVRRGREFADSDRAGAPPVAVVNEMMAQRFWKGDAIGALFRDTRLDADVQIVGIVADVRHRSFGEAPRPMVYFSADQRYHPRMTLHVQSSAPPAALGPAVVAALHAVDPAAGLARPQTMAEHMATASLPQRAGGLAAVAIGLLELALAVMALYGVMAFAMGQRTREIAVRLALGAPVGSITRLLMRDGLALALAGVAVGVVLALGAAQMLGSLLIGIGPADPVSFVGPAVLLLVVAAIASYVPARRALRADPTAVLRGE